MLNLHTTAPANALLTPTPVPASPGMPADGSGAPSAFARMLQGSQPPAAERAPKHDDAESSSQRAEAKAEPHGDSTSQAPASTHGATASPTSPGAREATRGRDDAKRNAAAKTSAHAPAQHAPRDAQKAKQDGGDAVDAKDDAATPQDPALASWLASLKLPDPQQPALPAAGTAAAGTPADADTPASPAPTTNTEASASAVLPAADAPAVQAAAGQAAVAALSAGQPAPGAKPPPAATPGDAGRDRAMDAAARGTPTAEAATAALASAVQARTAQGDAQSGTGGQGNTDKSPAAWTPVSSTQANLPQPTGALPMQFAAFATEAARPAREPVPVKLPTPVDSPEFPRAMGIELAVLARNGVEQAELHLTPAEMGPVSVQIAIDGTQARIDFGADMASTRQAIEAGLPELASALREAGLTLTGGGVSQHSRGQSNGGESQGANAGRGFRLPGSLNEGDTAAAAPAPARRLVRAGGVDMYA